MRARHGVCLDAGTESDHTWLRRPLLSLWLRIAVFVTPIGVSLGIAFLLNRTLPRATNPATAVLWFAVVLAVSLLTLIVFERAARRLLPLAALLNICMLFPDHAPARFAVARRAGSPADLRARLRDALDHGDDHGARHLQTVMELALALSVHDRATRGHSERVRVFTDLIADELDIPECDRARLRWAAILHDIGKLEVPASTLTKNGMPTEEEWVALHRHPEEGARLVAPLLPWLGEWGDAVLQHHERFDGTGYPRGLSGHQISLAARIVSVADCYEVMTAPRSYKRSLSIVAARQELTRVAGTQLDPDVVRAFLNVSVGGLWRRIGVGAWVAQMPTFGRLAGSFDGWAAGVATAMGVTVMAFAGLAGSPGSAPVLAGQLPRPQAIAGVGWGSDVGHDRLAGMPDEPQWTPFGWRRSSAVQPASGTPGTSATSAPGSQPSGGVAGLATGQGGASAGPLPPAAFGGAASAQAAPTTPGGNGGSSAAAGGGSPTGAGSFTGGDTSSSAPKPEDKDHDRDERGPQAEKQKHKAPHRDSEGGDDN